MSPLLAAVHLTELRTILPAVAAGAAAVFVLLPRPRPYPAWLGALFGAAAVLLVGATILRTGAVTAETLLFYAFSLIAVVSGVLLVTQHNPARAALSFALVILATCGLFLLLAAPFLMAATIIIYAGAIIVTFLFVLMLAQQEGPSDADARSREPLLATVTGFLLLGALVYVIQTSYGTAELDHLLARTRKAAGLDTEQAIHEAVGEIGEHNSLFKVYKELLKAHGLNDLSGEVQTDEDNWLSERDAAGMRRRLEHLLH